MDMEHLHSEPFPSESRIVTVQFFVGKDLYMSAVASGTKAAYGSPVIFPDPFDMTKLVTRGRCMQHNRGLLISSIGLRPFSCWLYEVADRTLEVTGILIQL